EKPATSTGHQQLDQYELVSAGPDGKFGTADDLKPWSINDWQRWQMVQWWWLADPLKADLRQGNLAKLQQRMFMLGRNRAMKGGEGRGALRDDMLMERAAGGPGGGFPVPAMAPMAADGAQRKEAAKFEAKPMAGQDKEAGGGGGGGAPPMRVREYF